MRLRGAVDCRHLPRLKEVRMERQLKKEEVWELVRAGEYTAYRVALGKNWEWRLEKRMAQTPV